MSLHGMALTLLGRIEPSVGHCRKVSSIVLDNAAARTVIIVGLAATGILVVVLDNAAARTVIIVCMA